MDPYQNDQFYERNVSMSEKVFHVLYKWHCHTGYATKQFLIAKLKGLGYLKEAATCDSVCKSLDLIVLNILNLYIQLNENIDRVSLAQTTSTTNTYFNFHFLGSEEGILYICSPTHT